MKKKILVVDDDPDIRNILIRFLTENGYEVCTANDGQDGMDTLRRELPDVVLLDINMPKLDGLEVLQAIQDEKLDVGVIMISGNADEERATESLRRGASDFVVKPFDLDYLEASLAVKLLMLEKE